MAKSLGHRVIGIAACASQAVATAREAEPGLGLADERLEDGSSGIQAVQTVLDGGGGPRHLGQGLTRAAPDRRDAGARLRGRPSPSTLRRSRSRSPRLCSSSRARLSNFRPAGGRLWARGQIKSDTTCRGGEALRGGCRRSSSARARSPQRAHRLDDQPVILRPAMGGEIEDVLLDVGPGIEIGDGQDQLVFQARALGHDLTIG